MALTGKRTLAAAGTVVVAAAVNVATGMLTQKWSLAWWVCTAVLVVVGATLQVWLTMSERAAERRQEFEDVEGRSLSQTMSGPGEQIVRRAKVTGNLTQRQDG
ncbi:hypothetical protein [Streptomyces sp900116325]|uniref:hypothetical protein n=1 Tax=Streptomyces sp. 900116325 TaxID=3154295 RepID=UPI0033D2A6F7